MVAENGARQSIEREARQSATMCAPSRILAPVAICFQSLRSSSSGNCLALWTPHSSILIDCGIKVQSECQSLLDAHVSLSRTLDGVLVSHSHGDHIAYAALRVLARHRITVHADRQVIRRLRERHGFEDWKHRPRLDAFSDDSFRIGDFRVTPFEVPHEPGVPTFGFVIAAHDGHAHRKIVFCTDFHDYAGALSRFVDADFVFVEANHDLALLRLHPNPASRWHLNNVKTASLLACATGRSASPPKGVMLGHLSEERNRRRLATGEIRRMFEREGRKVTFDLQAAPRYRPSPVVEF